MAYSSRIANQILVTPYDSKSVVEKEVPPQLTEKEFYDHCYSHPVFEKEYQLYTREEEGGNDSDFQRRYEEMVNQRHQQQIAYKNFNLWLEDYDNEKVYTISGNAGTGKTTFVNICRYREEKINWIILDIRKARRYDEWLADIRTEIERFERAQAKVYGSVMNEIWRLIFRGTDNNGRYSLENVYNNLKTLTQNYMEYFYEDYPAGRKLLDEVVEVMNSDKSMLHKVEQSAEIFKKYINGRVGDEGEEIIQVLNIFLISLRCMSKNRDDKYLIVFDNLERFIAKDELYNRDVDLIRRQLSDYVRLINEQGRIHKGYFKFAMAVRDSTARMCGVKLQAADENASDLDLNQWYDIRDIISRKKKWYKRIGISLENSELIEQITGDKRICTDRTITGLQLLIDPLFNNNKRLIIDFIGTMVESPRNGKYISIYKALWDEDTPQSRFAARSVIRGLILKELDNKQDKLFERLKTYSAQNRGSNGIGDARKILTILYNHIQMGEQDDMLLSAVIAELLHDENAGQAWKDERHARDRKIISEILFYMNSYNRRENDWIQFLDIQFLDKKGDIIAENPEQLESLLAEKPDRCTLHLLPAGRVYLTDIVASFEFFSIRYVPEYAPLFALIPTTKKLENDSIVIKELECYKKIKEISKYARKCINILRRGEDTIELYLNNRDESIRHAERIVIQHKAYIDRFVQYMKDKYCLSDETSEIEKKRVEILCREINALRDQYGNQ